MKQTKTSFKKSPERQRWEAEKVRQFDEAPTMDEFIRLVKEAEQEEIILWGRKE
ncbi:hypothetical protein [Methanoplanus limicola]|uniref:Uncharacterized protein n=1 Tax=Methanoplanus limicola DSM 2279 TaxID=937775 RepID=H1Z3N8_9EURY|nr:hypothetical protein [Methanoplanus limicola]EHQ35637.1 hypothetical protein Metlim_1536 [Methanoplanus limicola DSM 2279]